MDSSRNIIKKLRENKLLNEYKDYEGRKTEDLISRAQDGDQFATETLINRYMDLVRKMTYSKFSRTGSDREDLQQVATMGLWDAIMSYDIKKSGDFEAYAGMIIKRKLTDELRKEDSDKRRANADTTSLDATMDANDDSDHGGQMTKGENSGLVDKTSRSGLGLDPADVAIDNERTKDLLKYMKEKLSSTERDAVMMFIKGYKVSEIAEETGMKYKSVENALMRVKNKVADYLRTRESKKIREVDEIEFSDEEKELLKNVLTRINEEEEKGSSL